MTTIKDALKWPPETRAKIEGLVAAFAALQKQADEADDNPDAAKAVEDKWRELHGQAIKLYGDDGIANRLRQLGNVVDDEWPELDDLGESDGWPVYCFAIPGPEWLESDETFDEFYADDPIEEIVDSAEFISTRFAELLVPQHISDKDQAKLKEYAGILRERLELVEGMLSDS